ncbi:hypothetical protein GmHk_19G054620 [Glycine max]|nr:hypothetical protein GmHk_19G054620 [Glycine max]
MYDVLQELSMQKEFIPDFFWVLFARERSDLVHLPKSQQLPKVTNPSFSSAKPPPIAKTTPPPPTAKTMPPPLPIVDSHLPVNKHHTLSSDPLPAASLRSHTKPSSHGIHPSDIRFSLSIVCFATVRDTNLHHPFFLLLFAILVAAKGLCLHNHLQALIPTPIFIWDPGSVFCTQHLEDREEDALPWKSTIGVVISLEAVIVVVIVASSFLEQSKRYTRLVVKYGSVSSLSST